MHTNVGGFTRPDVISVVGGGWSFRYVDHAKVPGMVIGCNDAGLLLQRSVQHTVSMDRLWTENRWEQLCALKQRTWLRRSAVQNIDWMAEDWVRVFDCDHKVVDFSEEPARLNGTSTGTCALNLAHLLRPREVWLFGFDMCRSPSGEPYWYPPYPWTQSSGGTSNGKYHAWAAEFNTIALAFAQISCRVINVSEHSKIQCFTKMSPKQLGWEKK